MNPSEYIVPDLWTKQSVNVKDGIYLSKDNRYRGFFVIYSCKYKTSRVHCFCCFIPSPLMPYELAFQFFKSYEPNSPLYMQTVTGDFLTNKYHIRLINEWMFSWKLELKR